MPSTNPHTDALPKAYQHKKRKEWGLALIAWETDDKRGYLFEDGGLRVLAKGFYELMREVDAPDEEVAELYERLKPRLKPKSSSGSRQSQSNSHDLTFDDQLRVFLADFPEGFQDDKWVKKHRGGKSQRLKRHRAPAIQAAQERLNPEALQAKVAEGEFADVWQEVLKVLGATDLVSAGKLKTFAITPSRNYESLANAVVELVGENGELEPRLGTFLTMVHRTFGKTAPWELATAVPALRWPASYVCVSPTSFRQLAKWLAPGLAPSSKPTPIGYTKSIELAELTQSKLIAAGHEPRDFLDVYDFIRLTTTPSAKKRAWVLSRGSTPAGSSDGSGGQADDEAA